MDPIFRTPAGSGKPLWPITAMEMNRREHDPNAPGIPAGLLALKNYEFPSSHSRSSSDVQNKVEQFNTMSKEAAQRRKDNEASLKRAVLGREEAENEAKRLRDENRLLRREIEEGRARERRVGERVEGVMEELQRKQETYAHSQAIYEREVRRARKEAFKSSSALLELQEEMKSIRNKYALVKEEVKVQKRKVEDKEQEAFAAQYQLAGLQEDLDSLTQQVKVGDDVKDALRTSLREEESARIAADEEKRALRSRLREEEVARTAVEGKIALMVSKEEDQLTSPKKKSEKRDSLKENEDPEIEEGNQELVMIQRALNMEKQLRQIAEDTIDFMKMECQFKSCSCRIAEVHRKAYIHDNGPAAQLTHKASKNPRISKLVSTIDRFIGTTTTQTSPDSSTEPTITQSLHASPQPQDTIDENNGDEYVYDTGPSAQSVPEASQNPDPSKSIPTATTNIDPSGEPTTTEYAPTSPEQPEDPDDHLITFSPKTGTFCAIPTAVTASSSPETLSPIRVSQFSARPLPPMPLNTRSRHPSPLGQPPLSHSRSPSPTPIKRSATDPSRSSSPTPTTVSREQALEQIRMRRGRARSIAAGLSTPRRPMMGAEVERRDISAPVCGSVSGRESKGF